MKKMIPIFMIIAVTCSAQARKSSSDRRNNQPPQSSELDPSNIEYRAYLLALKVSEVTGLQGHEHKVLSKKVVNGEITELTIQLDMFGMCTYIVKEDAAGLHFLFASARCPGI